MTLVVWPIARALGGSASDHLLTSLHVAPSYVSHQLLIESAERRPKAEAVRLLDQALTYGELEKLSNQLAQALIEIGVVSSDRVGI